NFIAEFIKINIIFFAGFIVHIPIYINAKARKILCQLDVYAFLTDRQRYLVGLKKYGNVVILRVQLHPVDPRRGKRTLNQQLDVAGEVDDVNILIPQFTHDTMDTASFHTYTGAYRIDPVVVAFDS